MKKTKQKRRKLCFTDKYRKRVKKQQAVKEQRKRERERERRADKERRIPTNLHRPAYLYWKIQRVILLRRLRDLLKVRIAALHYDEFSRWHEPEASLRDELEMTFRTQEMGEPLTPPEVTATAASVVCPLCKIAITPEHYRYNVERIKYNGQPVLVHKVCPNEPGYVWLREGSPGSIMEIYSKPELRSKEGCYDNFGAQ